jgi:hypothetical protein
MTVSAVETEEEDVLRNLQNTLLNYLCGMVKNLIT